MSVNEIPTFPEPDSEEFRGMAYAYSQLAAPLTVMDKTSTCLYANQAALDLLGAGSLGELTKPITEDWNGRLKPVEAPDSLVSRQEENVYFQNPDASRIYTRHTYQLPVKDSGSVKMEILQDVTTLYEGEERVKIMIDAAPLCCNYWNGDFQNVDCNLEATKLFDLPDRKTYLERFNELSPELQPNGRKSGEEALRHITKAFKTGYDRFEWMHQKLNGEQIPAEITLVKVQMRGGDVVLGYTRDLRSSRLEPEIDDIEWITGIFNSLPFPIGVASSSGKWMYMNQIGLDMLGLDSVSQLSEIPSSDWGGRLEPLPHENQDQHSHYVDKTTGKVYLRFDAPLKDNFGGLVGRVETLQDQTRQYEAEERIRAMVDAAPLCCNFWNKNFENIECNLEAAKLFDLPDKQTYLERFFELSPEYQPNGEKSSEAATKNITKAFKEGFARFEWMHQKLNGEPVPSEITLVRVNLREGDVVLGYTRDLR